MYVSNFHEKKTYFFFVKLEILLTTNVDSLMVWVYICRWEGKEYTAADFSVQNTIICWSPVGIWLLSIPAKKIVKLNIQKHKIVSHLLGLFKKWNDLAKCFQICHIFLEYENKCSLLSFILCRHNIFPNNYPHFCMNWRNISWDVLNIFHHNYSSEIYVHRNTSLQIIMLCCLWRCQMYGRSVWEKKHLETVNRIYVNFWDINTIPLHFAV